jgi:hypothetical protein
MKLTIETSATIASEGYESDERPPMSRSGKSIRKEWSLMNRMFKKIRKQKECFVMALPNQVGTKI